MASGAPEFGAGDYRDLPEWQAATRFAARVGATAEALELPLELEWLRYLLRRSGDVVAPIVEEAWGRAHLAEYLLGLYESLDHVVLLEYYVPFLEEEGYLSTRRAAELDEERAALHRVIGERVAELRANWRATHEYARSG